MFSRGIRRNCPTETVQWPFPSRYALDSQRGGTAPADRTRHANQRLPSHKFAVNVRNCGRTHGAGWSTKPAKQPAPSSVKPCTAATRYRAEALELPPDDLLENTWSHSRNVWPEGHSRPRTSNRRSRKGSFKPIDDPPLDNRPATGKRVYEVPLILNNETRTRVLSANRVPAKSRIEPPRKARLALQSSLDRDFLTLFD